MGFSGFSGTGSCPGSACSDFSATKIFTCTDGGMYGSSIHTKKSARLKGNGITIPKSVGEFEIALIPKSSPEDKNVLEQVCREIVKKERFILGSAFDGSDLLVRTKGLSPVHYGGVHSVEEIAGSMKVSRPLKSKKIILLDDLVFSGRTDLACRKLLMDAGAEEIFTICMYGYNRPTS